jgi:phosphatidyl-myo-inositol dimannoside synthase
MPGLGARQVIMVSAGLDLDGGGSAVVGRLVATAVAGYCAGHGLDFRVFHLGASTDVLPGIPVRSFRGNQAAMALATWREQLRSNTAALIFDHIGPARTQAFVPKRLRVPYLVVLLGVEVWRTLGWDRRRALANATVRLAISSHTRTRAIEFSPWLPATDVLYPALEERPPGDDVDQGLLSKVGRGFVLIAGRMAPDERYKGHDALLAAMPGVIGRVKDAKLVIAGGGEDRGRLEQQASAWGLRDRVCFTGFVGEATLAELFRRSAVFAMPSRDEGFGLVYLEAMKAGKPCVAARGSAAEEIIVDGATGVLVNYGDPRGLADALVKLLADSEGARRFGEAGHEHWKKRFNRQLFQTGLHSVLARLIS